MKFEVIYVKIIIHCKAITSFPLILVLMSQGSEGTITFPLINHLYNRRDKEKGRRTQGLAYKILNRGGGGGWRVALVKQG